jgi:hypothetical protein
VYVCVVFLKILASALRGSEMADPLADWMGQSLSPSIASSPLLQGYGRREVALSATNTDEKGKQCAPTFAPNEKESASEQLWYWKQQQQQQKQEANTSAADTRMEPSPVILITCNMQKDFFSVLPQRQNTMNKSDNKWRQWRRTGQLCASTPWQEE